MTLDIPDLGVSRPSGAASADPRVHFFTTAHGVHMLATDGSRIFDVSPSLQNDYAGWSDIERAEFLSGLGVRNAPYVDDTPPADMPIRALSLAVAQKCNLACTYCYASGGDFGGPARNMEWDVAKASVDRLFSQAEDGARVNLAFMGGEPLVNRPLVRQATAYALQRARERGVKVGFSITTNGTLVSGDDADFFNEHRFAVTISLDGVGQTHDRLRPYRNGRGSFDAILQRLAPLLGRMGHAQVSARVTVTPENLELRKTLDHFVALGFHSVGFAPMLSAPDPRHELDMPHLNEMLVQMIDCATGCEEAILQGKPYPFSNMEAAMMEIHRGTHRPYPCGAGAGYMGVSAEGGLFACHRFVEDEAGAMGAVQSGVDSIRRDRWLADRHVHKQSPCNTCWAQYLCGGGCHHEVIRRGRPACDYIRGWLDHCLGAYVRIQEARPEYFAPPATRPTRS